jgi:ferrous iron transport protein B
MNHCEVEVKSKENVKLGEKTVTIALAGQPNQGKSTLFNLLTGLNQHVGNWTGKTVERCEGTFHYNNQAYTLVDLPGTYSLTANSPEEVVAREFILHEQPDAVVAVVNAANLERSLYLVAELVCLPVPIIVVLNMMDVAQQEGIHVEPEVLSAALGLPVIPMTATRARGVQDLLAKLDGLVAGQYHGVPRQPEIRADHQELLKRVQKLTAEFVPAPYPPSWVALKLLEGDQAVSQMMQSSAMPPQTWAMVQTALREHDDALLAIVSGRYEWIDRMVRAAVVRPKLGQVSLTDRIDRVAVHPVGGLVVLAGVLGVIFGLTFAVGAPMQEWLDHVLVSGLAQAVSWLLRGAPDWLRGLVVDGMIGGAGTVITFLPILVIFFTALSVLEDVGYMARAAYVMDNFMHMMGLHGKSFLPLFLGFGCNVPAVMGSRVIESRPARLLTILISPFVPCTARLAVIAFLAPAFFGPQAALVTWGVVLFALAALILSGILLNRTVFKGERSAFIMEMPLYHMPNWKSIVLQVWRQSYSFLKKAGTTILAMAVFIWFLSSVPGGGLENSLLGRLGHALAPLGSWLGLDWRLVLALLTSFVAKENAVATLGVLFNSSESSLAQALAATYSPASGLAFIVVTVLFVPCMPTVAVMRQETGSWRWVALNLVLMLAVSLAAGGAVYSLARLGGL